jgi:hypothetical protein
MSTNKPQKTKSRPRKTALAAKPKGTTAQKTKKNTKNKTAAKLKKTRPPSRSSPSGRPPSKQSLARTSKKDKLVHLNIAEARMNISRVVSEIEASNQVFTLGRRNEPNALLLPFEKFEPLLRDDYRSKLAFLVVDHLMADAPQHIRQPQIE